MASFKKFAVLSTVFTFLFSLTTPIVSAQVQVEEFMANPNNSSDVVVRDAAGEWVEIANNGTEAVDISGWIIETGRVGDSTPTDDTFPTGTVLQPSQAIVVCDNSNTDRNGGVACDLILSIALTNRDGKIVLRDPVSLEIVDEVTYYSASTPETKPSEEYEDIEEGTSANVERNEDGEQTGTTNTTDGTYGPTEDETDEDTPPQNGTPSSNTVYNQNNPDHRYATIQEAIDDSTDGDTIIVAGNQTPAEDVIITKDITLTSEDKCEFSVEGLIILDAIGSSVSNLAILNPSENGAIEVTAHNTSVTNNCISNVGTEGTVGNTEAIFVNSGAEPLNGVTIAGNTISSVSSESHDATAIIIEEVTNLTIANNTITDVFSTKTAAAIVLEADTTGVLISGNDLATITGQDQSFGIALAGSNVNTLISGNNLDDITSGGAAVGVVILDDTTTSDLASIVIQGNLFNDVTVGIQNEHVAIAENRVFAQMNDWGGPSGPSDPENNDASLPLTNNGTGVQAIGAIDYRNWVGFVEQDEEEPTAPTPTTQTPTVSPASVSTTQNSTTALTTFQLPTTDNTQQGNVESENETTPQTSSTSDEIIDQVAQTNTDNDWLEQNWLIIIIIVLGGGVIWYFFVRPNEIN